MSSRLRCGLALVLVLLLAATGCGGGYAAEPPQAPPLLLEPVESPTPPLPEATASPEPLPPESPVPPPPTETLIVIPTSSPLATPAPPEPRTGGAGPGIWTDLPTYVESQPGMFFQVDFDPELWLLVEDTQGFPLLASLVLPGCTIELTAGRGLAPDWTVESSFRPVGDLIFEVVVASQNGQARFVNYYGGDGIVFTGFKVSFSEQMDACLQAAEMVLASLRSTPAEPTPTP
ncbi:MAG: hypothetical protein JXB85_16920 [Anaerolineales bacterium]|nr:hypothetical protein [Anaerolineales bacterium]